MPVYSSRKHVSSGLGVREGRKGGVTKWAPLTSYREGDSCPHCSDGLTYVDTHQKAPGCML